MLPVILLILQIVGAIPAIIDAVKYLWELISTIRDRKTRLKLRAELRHAALHSVDQDAKTINMASTAGALAALHSKVLDVIREESQGHLNALGALK